MPYINKITKQFNISEQDIKSLYPLTSFPAPFVAPDEYTWVFPGPQPTYDPITQAIREIAPVLTAKGHYEQQWEIVPRYVEYTDAEGVLHTVDEQIAAAAAAVLQAKREAMVVTPWAMCKALNRLSLLETVESAIAASNDIDLKYGWARAQDFKRLDGFVLTMQAALGKSDEFMDELFELAMTL